MNSMGVSCEYCGVFVLSVCVCFCSDESISYTFSRNLMAEDHRVKLVSFTGSTAIGKKV